ncbi:MAG: PDZ domain-containing protein [Terriglobus sp.]
MTSSKLATRSFSLILLAVPFPVAQATLLHVSAVMAMHGHGSAAGNHAVPAQGYLGIVSHDVSDSTFNAQHLKDKRGAEIVMVDHDGPAGKAGLREHDVVLAMNGTNIEGDDQFKKMLHDMAAGRMISLYICRDGIERTVTVILSTREEVNKQAMQQRWTVPAPVDESNLAADDTPPAPPPSSKGGMFSHSFMSGHLLPLLPVYTGAVVDTMGPQLAAYFGVKDGKGLLVHSVENNSAASFAGLHAGDVVTRMNGAHVNTEREWQHALHEAKGKPITLVVMRERKELIMTLVADGKKHSEVVEPKFGADVGPMQM